MLSSGALTHGSRGRKKLPAPSRIWRWDVIILRDRSRRIARVESITYLRSTRIDTCVQSASCMTYDSLAVHDTEKIEKNWRTRSENREHCKQRTDVFRLGLFLHPDIQLYPKRESSVEQRASSVSMDRMIGQRRALVKPSNLGEKYWTGQDSAWSKRDHHAKEHGLSPPYTPDVAP